MRLGCWIVMLALAGGIAGCDRKRVASPATAPAATASATTVPAVSESVYMLIDDRRVEFPPAKLRIRDRGDMLAAVLYSDDPKTAIDDKYGGNSFYFDMVLDVGDVKDLGSAQWNFKATSSERMDTVSGIFLEGRKFHLQPSDVQVEFSGNESSVTAFVRGAFLLFDPFDDTLPPKIIPVRAELKAELTSKK